MSFVLVLSTLGNLSDLLGSDEAFDGAGTVVWVGALLLALMAWFAVRFDSGISTLIAALTFVVVLVSFVDWVFSPDGTATFRWILLAAAVALTAFAALGPERGPHHAPYHAVGYVNAAGAALFGISILYGIDAFESLFGGDETLDAGAGWELLILAGGFALLAYSVWARQSGPAYLGALNLSAFIFLAGTAGDDGPSLIGWPIVMVLATAALLVAALRPSGGTPPDPSLQAKGPSPNA